MTANVAQPLRGDQLFSVLLTSLDIDESESKSVSLPTSGRGSDRSARGSFNAAFGFDPSTPRESVNASIPQMLTMMNSSQIDNALAPSTRRMLGKVLRSIKDDRQLVEELYLRCY